MRPTNKPSSSYELTNTLLGQGKGIGRELQEPKEENPKTSTHKHKILLGSWALKE